MDEKHTPHHEADGVHYEAEYRADYEDMTAGEYLKTRFSSLKPPMTKVANPFKLLAMLNGKQWAFFIVSEASCHASKTAWQWDN